MNVTEAAAQNAKIIEAYLKAHHDAIRRHDPNHLILGDKIQNARPQPDWVWEIVKRYVDVIVIQDYVELHLDKEHKSEVTLRSTMSECVEGAAHSSVGAGPARCY